MRCEILKYNRIRDMRSDKNFSQSHVAQLLNVAQNTYSQYETGERNIPNEILIQLAFIHETSVDYLLGITDEKCPYSRKLQH
jgi:transcriptional regulator with XRE-family HTH domain